MNKPGRPKGEHKIKSTIRCTPRLRSAISALIAFANCKNYSDAIEKGTVDTARRIIQERGASDHFPELFQ